MTSISTAPSMPITARVPLVSAPTNCGYTQTNHTLPEEVVDDDSATAAATAAAFKQPQLQQQQPAKKSSKAGVYISLSVQSDHNDNPTSYYHTPASATTTTTSSSNSTTNHQRVAVSTSGCHLNKGGTISQSCVGVQTNNNQESAIKNNLNNNRQQQQTNYELRFQEEFNKMRERLFRMLSKVPIQVETVIVGGGSTHSPPQQQQIASSESSFLLTSSTSSMSSSSSSQQSHNNNNNKVIDREPLMIKYYNERSLADILDLHFGCSLIKHNYDQGIALDAHLVQQQQQQHLHLLQHQQHLQQQQCTDCPQQHHVYGNSLLDHNNHQAYEAAEYQQHSGYVEWQLHHPVATNNSSCFSTWHLQSPYGGSLSTTGVPSKAIVGEKATNINNTHHRRPSAVVAKGALDHSQCNSSRTTRTNTPPKTSQKTTTIKQTNGGVKRQKRATTGSRQQQQQIITANNSSRLNGVNRQQQQTAQRTTSSPSANLNQTAATATSNSITTSTTSFTSTTASATTPSVTYEQSFLKQDNRSSKQIVAMITRHDSNSSPASQSFVRGDTTFAGNQHQSLMLAPLPATTFAQGNPTQTTATNTTAANITSDHYQNHQHQPLATDLHLYTSTYHSQPGAAESSGGQLPLDIVDSCQPLLLSFNQQPQQQQCSIQQQDHHQREPTTMVFAQQHHLHQQHHQPYTEPTNTNRLQQELYTATSHLNHGPSLEQQHEHHLLTDPSTTTYYQPTGYQSQLLQMQRMDCGSANNWQLCPPPPQQQQQQPPVASSNDLDEQHQMIEQQQTNRISSENNNNSNNRGFYLAPNNVATNYVVYADCSSQLMSSAHNGNNLELHQVGHHHMGHHHHHLNSSNLNHLNLNHSSSAT